MSKALNSINAGNQIQDFGSAISAIVMPAISSMFIFPGSLPQTFSRAPADITPIMKMPAAIALSNNGCSEGANERIAIQKMLPTVPGAKGE